MNMTQTIIKACDCAVGASLADIKKALGRDDNAVGVMVASIANTGRIFGAGPRMRKRYFTDPANAAAYEARCAAESDKHAAEVLARRIARYAARNEARREATAAKKAAMPTKPPKKKAEPKPQAKRPFDQTIMPTVIKTTGFKKEVQIVIPPGLKITQCPSAWKDKPLPEPDAAIPKREGAEDWRKCGRGMF